MAPLASAAQGVPLRHWEVLLVRGHGQIQETQLPCSSQCIPAHQKKHIWYLVWSAVASLLRGSMIPLIWLQNPKQLFPQLSKKTTNHTTINVIKKEREQNNRQRQMKKTMELRKVEENRTKCQTERRKGSVRLSVAGWTGSLMQLKEVQGERWGAFYHIYSTWSQIIHMK